MRREPRRVLRHGRGPLTVTVAAATLLLGACTTDHTPPHIKDGRGDLDLSVTGQPSSETLALVEKTLVRLQKHDEKGLAKLSFDGKDAKETARGWVARWGEAAQKPMVADFAVDPKKYVIVEVRFHGVKGVLPLTLEADMDDGWTYGLVTREGAYEE